MFKYYSQIPFKFIECKNGIPRASPHYEVMIYKFDYDNEQINEL